MKKPYFVGMVLVGSLALTGCGSSAKIEAAPSEPTTGTFMPRTDAPQATYSWIRDNIFSVKCMDCHSQHDGDGDGLKKANFDSYEQTLSVVRAGSPEKSKLYIAVFTKKMPKAMDPMPGMPNPPAPVPLTDAQLKAVYDWIAAGAPNN